jgi:F-type H+-transporting ATPase subunit a
MPKPSIDDLFPAPIFFKGTIFELNRMALIRIIATVGLLLLFFLISKTTKLIPTKKQSIFEMIMEFVYNNIALTTLRTDKTAKKYFPYIAFVFFGVLFMNITEIIPLLNAPSTALVATPLLLAILSWLMFIIAGIKKNGVGKYFKRSLFPEGIPKPLYILMTPIEFISTYILRPLTLTVRLMANMISGHLLLVTFYTMSSYILFHAALLLKPVLIVSFLACFAFTLFEIFVCCLQAYIFALLSAVYIDLSRSH